LKQGGRAPLIFGISAFDSKLVSAKTLVPVDVLSKKFQFSSHAPDAFSVLVVNN